METAGGPSYLERAATFRAEFRPKRVITDEVRIIDSTSENLPVASNFITYFPQISKSAFPDLCCGQN